MKTNTTIRRPLAVLSLLLSPALLALTPHTSLAGPPPSDEGAKLRFQKRAASQSAEDFYREGSKLANAGEVKAAIPNLKEAVRQEPDNASYQYALADAHYRLDEMNEAWAALRACVRIEPENEDYANGFLVIWKSQVELDVLDIGQTYHDVVNTLGEPDEIDGDNGTGTVSYGFMCVSFEDNKVTKVIDTRGLTREIAFSSHVLVFDVDRSKWTPEFYHLNKSCEMKMFKPNAKAGKTAAPGTEELCMQRIPLAGRSASTAEFRDRMMNIIKANSPDTTIEILQESRNDFYYLCTTPATEESRGNWEIGRIIKSDNDFFQVGYTTTVQELTEEDIDRWGNLFAEAEVILQDEEDEEEDAPSRDEIEEFDTLTLAMNTRY